MKNSTHTRIKNRSARFSPEKKAVISECLILFVNWLRKQKLKDFNHRSEIIFETFHIDDTMKVDKQKAMHFNLEYLKKCSVNYFITIVLHEAFHAYIHNIPNKRDATRVKDFYANQMMLHLDVEADYYVAKFLRDTFNLELRDYIGVYFSGAKAFKDDETRPMKFERFVSSMLSIAHLFEHDEFALYRISSEAVRASRSKPIVIVHKGLYSETKRIKLTLKSLNEMQRLYEKPDSFYEERYVEKLHNIIYHAVDGHKKKVIRPRLKFAVPLRSFRKRA